MTDLTVIGGGIVGIATALEMQRSFPGLDIAVLEKEPALARHQTGRNSGVIHAGIYYAPGSLKARLCREGLHETVRFCREHGLPFDQCGKLIVATRKDEVGRLSALAARARQNGLDVREIPQSELRRIEPEITGLAALLSPATGIADYAAITRQMAQLFRDNGGQIRLGATVEAIAEDANRVRLRLQSGEEMTTRHLIACAGLQADRIAAMCGLGGDFAIVPFKGEYFRLAPRHDRVVDHLIYPVPNPDLPFLGIHLTRMIGGYVTVGPNAVLSLSREGIANCPRTCAICRTWRGFRGSGGPSPAICARARPRWRIRRCGAAICGRAGVTVRGWICRTCGRIRRASARRRSCATAGWCMIS